MQKNLSQIPKRSAAGVDGQTVEAATESYVWRAVDHEGEILDMLVQRRRDTRAALRLMRKLLKKQGFAPKLVVTEQHLYAGSADNAPDPFSLVELACRRDHECGDVLDQRRATDNSCRVFKVPTGPVDRRLGARRRCKMADLDACRPATRTKPAGTMPGSASSICRRRSAGRGVIAQVNPELPWTYGDTAIEPAAIDVLEGVSRDARRVGVTSPRPSGWKPTWRLREEV